MSIAAALGIRDFQPIQGSAPDQQGLPATAIHPSIQNLDPIKAWQSWRALLDDLVSAQSTPTGNFAPKDDFANGSPVAQIANRNATPGPAPGQLPATLPNSRLARTDPRQHIVFTFPADSSQVSSGINSAARGSHPKNAKPSLPTYVPGEPRLPKSTANQNVSHEQNSIQRISQSNSVTIAPANENVPGSNLVREPAPVFHAVLPPAIPAQLAPAHNVQSHSEPIRFQNEGSDLSHFQWSSSIPDSGEPAPARSISSGGAREPEPQPGSVLRTMQTDTPYPQENPGPANPTNDSTPVPSLPEDNKKELTRAFPSKPAPVRPSEELDAITAHLIIRKTDFASHDDEQAEFPHATSGSAIPKPVSSHAPILSGMSPGSNISVHPGHTPPEIDILHPLSAQHSSEAGSPTPPPSAGEPTAKASANHLGISEESLRALDSSSFHPPESWSMIGAHRAEAGFHDPSLGWITVRAQAGAGGIHATVIPSSSEAAESLGSHLGALNAFMQAHSSQVDSIRLASPEPGTEQTMAFAGNGHEGSRQQQNFQDTRTDADSLSAPGLAGDSITQREPSSVPAISIVTDRHVSVLVE
jgi:hypothetical protein